MHTVLRRRARNASALSELSVMDRIIIRTLGLSLGVPTGEGIRKAVELYSTTLEANNTEAGYLHFCFIKSENALREEFLYYVNLAS